MAVGTRTINLALAPGPTHVSGTYSTHVKKTFGVRVGKMRLLSTCRHYFVDGFAGGLGAIQIPEFLRTCLWSCYLVHPSWNCTHRFLVLRVMYLTTDIK